MRNAMTNLKSTKSKAKGAKRVWVAMSVVVTAS